MLIRTNRFGMVDVDAERIIEFEGGILGFPEQRRYALIQTNDDPVFFWLQAVDEPSLAFVVCDPHAFVPDYQAPIRRDDVAQLGIDDLGDAQVLVIVNKVQGGLAVNLLGPLVVGASSRRGKQLVLSSKRYSTRHPLPDFAPRAVSKTA